MDELTDEERREIGQALRRHQQQQDDAARAHLIQSPPRRVLTEEEEFKLDEAARDTAAAMGYQGESAFYLYRGLVAAALGPDVISRGGHRE